MEARLARGGLVAIGAGRATEPVVARDPERGTIVPEAPLGIQLSGSIGEPAFPSRPGLAPATARNAGDGRSGATRNHAQRSEHGEDGEHRTFPAVSTVASSPPVGRSLLRTDAPLQVGSEGPGARK